MNLKRPTICSLTALFLAIAGPVLHAQGDPAFWGWAPTPPMGWNSYDAYGTSITEDEFLANARFLRERLLPHGWRYAVIDARWYDAKSPLDDRDFNKTRVGVALCADEFGRLLPSPERFPSAAGGRGFRPLADQTHAMGLKFGFHIMRGIPRQAVQANTPIEGSTFTARDAADLHSTCNWCPDMFGVRTGPAGQAWYDSLFKLYASWGLDFVKVDDLSHPYSAGEIEMIRQAIDRCGRPIVFSTSPGPTPVAKAEHIAHLANMWRISGDFWDDWKKVNAQFDLVVQWQGVAGPGHWPDADMLPLGHIGFRCTIAGGDRWTRLTKDEQITLFSLWAIAPSPLMLGMSLPDLDPWTLSMLTNDEVLALNQDPLGRGARRISQKKGLEVWLKELKDGSMAVGLFNRSDSAADVSASWAELKLTGSQRVRDVWQHKDLGFLTESISQPVPTHGAVLLRFTAEHEIKPQ